MEGSPIVRVSGSTEFRIAYEVALHLRILPRFSDDGVPEGTVDRPLSTGLVALEPSAIEPAVEHIEIVDEEDEIEIVLDGVM
jgi:hypothetical protein